MGGGGGSALAGRASLRRWRRVVIQMRARQSAALAASLWSPVRRSFRRVNMASANPSSMTSCVSKEVVG